MAGQGTISSIGKDVWKLRVSVGRNPLTGRYEQRTRVFRGEGKRAAQRALIDFIQEVEQSNPFERTRTLNQVIERWLAVHDVEVQTMRSYRTTHRKHIQSGIGTTKICDLTPFMLDLFYKKLSDQGYSSSAVSKVHAVISGACQQAVRWQMLPNNPARDATLPRKTQQPLNIPDLEMISTIISSASDSDVGFSYAMYATIGMRRSELLAMRWTDLRENHGTMYCTISRSLVQLEKDEKPKNDYVHVHGRLYLKDTKTHAQREMAIGHDLMRALAEHRSRQEKRAADAGVELAKDAFLFAKDPEGLVPWNPNWVSQRFIRLRKKLGWNVRLHDLRHFNASHMAGEGHSIKVIGARLGHSDERTTMRYLHVRSQDDQAAAKSFDGLIRL